MNKLLKAVLIPFTATVCWAFYLFGYKVWWHSGTIVLVEGLVLFGLIVVVVVICETMLSTHGGGWHRP